MRVFLAHCSNSILCADTHNRNDAVFALVRHVRAQEERLGKYQFSRQASMGGNLTQSMRELSRKEDRRRHTQSRKVTGQALRFVGVFYLTWTFATINRIIEQANGQSYFWLMCLHTVFVPLQGFFNYFVFMYPKFKRWRRERRKKAGQSKVSSFQYRHSGMAVNFISRLRQSASMSSVTGSKRGGSASAANAVQINRQHEDEQQGEGVYSNNNKGRRVSYLCDAVTTDERNAEDNVDIGSTVGSRVDMIDDCVCIDSRSMSANDANSVGRQDGSAGAV